MKIRLLAIAATGLALAASQARAQTAGTYSGTTQDGNNISFVVGSDGNGGLLISSLNYGLTSTCHPGTSTFNTAWGLGTGAEITHQKAHLTYSFGYLYTAASFAFNGTTATGTISSLTPTFAPHSGPKPKRAVFCSSPAQPFTVTYSTGTPSAPPRQATATVMAQTTK